MKNEIAIITIYHFSRWRVKRTFHLSKFFFFLLMTGHNIFNFFFFENQLVLIIIQQTMTIGANKKVITCKKLC